MCHAIVIGAGPLGRQVAILLASLGVRHLSLYDQRIVTDKDMAHGFLDYDVGTPAVDAVANIAHQYHPQMELLTYDARFRRSHVASWKAGQQHAVFLCNEAAATRKSHWQWIRHSAHFLCAGAVGTETIHIVCSDQPSHRPPALSLATEPDATPDVVTANLSAALMVQQFSRWLKRLPCKPTLSFDLSACGYVVQK